MEVDEEGEGNLKKAKVGDVTVEGVDDDLLNAGLSEQLRVTK